MTRRVRRNPPPAPQIAARVRANGGHATIGGREYWLHPTKGWRTRGEGVRRARIAKHSAAAHRRDHWPLDVLAAWGAVVEQVLQGLARP